MNGRKDADSNAFPVIDFIAAGITIPTSEKEATTNFGILALRPWHKRPKVTKDDP